MTQVQVRYWAGAQAAAGVETESLTGDTVSAVLDRATAAHPGLESVLTVASVLVDGRRAGRDEAVSDGSTVEVLPPFAGG